MAHANVIQGYFAGRAAHVAAVHPVQRHAVPGGGDAFQLPAHAANFSRGGGQPLPSDVRMKMESFFGTNFADVRVHVGPQASAIGALAFTQGSDIHFAPGQYNPSTPQGQQILGHELAHVVQQRSGRVRNPFGNGVAVVQDRALEAEADRMGQRAAAHLVQAKMPATLQRTASIHVAPPVKTNDTTYRIAANAGGASVGSVMLHERDNSSVLVTDLGVDPNHRSQGVGGALLASAARAAMQLGKTKVVLDSQDNGSGHLTQWYKRMGFVQTGVGRNGMPHLEAPANRVISGAAQAKMAPHVPQPRLQANAVQSKTVPLPQRTVQRSAVAVAPRTPRATRKTRIQLDQVCATLDKTWKGQTAAGTLDAAIAITTVGSHSCGASIILTQSRGNVSGTFDSDALHAEMDALHNLFAGGHTLADIHRLEIETAPCPRCAVVINRLGISGVTFYKTAGGHKDYPTWRFPTLGATDFAATLGINTHVTHTDDKDELKTYFRTHKWWG